jgi:hypothetical protein
VLSAFANIFRVQELKNRVLFTFAILLVYRIGIHVPVPGVDVGSLAIYLEKQTAGGVLGFLNTFSGGALKQASIFALGVMPYISMSIILQLLTAVIPIFGKIVKRGGNGSPKNNAIHKNWNCWIMRRSRFGNYVPIAFFQQWELCLSLGNWISVDDGFGFNDRNYFYYVVGRADYRIWNR